MTQEQKAKAYDEVREKIAIRFGSNVTEEIFSEYEESEDERIRKDIISHFAKGIEGSSFDEVREKYKIWIAWLEKQGEQKPVDKVEPKFKVGDWVVRGSTIAQILDIQEQYYVGLDINGKDFTSSRFLDDDKIHLWTINDAKDGDVLVTGNKNIFIFKSISGYTIYDYCGLYFEKFANSSGTVNGTAATKLPIDYVPATKEQRELLFSKMIEAGYTWDIEKKELKKIEQKPAWSEEDEEIHRKCICAMRASACGFPEEEKFVEQVDNWFKCLKERYTWKPSDEQIKALERAMIYCPETETLKDAIYILEQLKKLREE